MQVGIRKQSTGSRSPSWFPDGSGVVVRSGIGISDGIASIAAASTATSDLGFSYRGLRGHHASRLRTKLVKLDCQ